MIRAVKADIESDLQPLSLFLHRAGIQHRIIEESGKQVICVFTRQQEAFVSVAYAKWEKGELNAELPGVLSQGQEGSLGGVRGNLPSVTLRYLAIFLKSFTECPVTWLLILSCLLVAIMSRMGTVLGPVVFLFYPPIDPTQGLTSTITQLLNPLTFLQALAPMFLHFGEMHIVFNLLWLVVFGRQIEVKQSSLQFLLVVVFISLISNTAQFLTNYQSNFGGMSGVVYGLLGYVWVWQWIYPREGLRMQQSMFVFFIVALVLMGIMAPSLIATPAHVGGLLAGVVIGVALALAKRTKVLSAL